MLAGQRLDVKGLERQAEAFAAMGRSLKTGGEFLLYGCDLAAGQAGDAFIHEFARVTGANVAASTNKTGAAALGGDWVLEARTGVAPVEPMFTEGFDYPALLPVPITGVDPNSNPVYVRPGGISNTWTFGPFNSVGNGAAGIPDGPATVSRLVYYDSGTSMLTRGKFQYSTDGGSSWTDMPYGNPDTSTGLTVAGKMYRFVDNKPADTTTTDSFFTAWSYVSYGAVTSGGQTVFADNPPTDVFPIALDYWGTPAPGDVIVGLSKTDTGNPNGGVYGIDSQSVPNLFSISGASLSLGSGALPAVGQSSTVTLHYYDIYQTDSSGAPIGGQGVTRAVTMTHRANPSGFGNDLHANTFTTNAQANAQVAGLSDGSFVVVWRSVGQDGETTSFGGIYGQKYTAAGVASGSEFAISPAGNGINESAPTVSALSGGRFVVAYVQANADNDVIYRIVNADGSLTAETSVASTTTGNQTAPWATTLSTGNFAIAWIGPNGADTADVWVRQFDGTTGAALASSEQVVNTLQTGSQSIPGVAGLSDGNCAVSWRDPANSGDVYARVMGTTAAVSSQITVISTAATQANPRIAALTGGGFVVTYSESGRTEGGIADTTSQSNIYARRYDNTGTLQGSEFLVNAGVTFNQITPAISRLSGGGFIIGWTSNTDPDGTNGVFARRFDATGTAVDAFEFQLNQRRTDAQTTPSLTALASDSFATSWTDATLDGTGNSGIGARVFTAAVSASAPAVTTATQSGVTATSAALGGNVTSDGGASVTDRGIVWGTSTGPTTADNKVANGTGTGSFSATVSSLPVATTVFVRAYATNSVTTSYGNEISFTTLAQAPTVTTAAQASVTSTSATLGGNVTSDGGASVTDRGIVWGLSANPTTANTKVANGTGTGSFSATVSGLPVATTVHVRAYATNTVTTSYGSDISFTTPANLPTIITPTATGALSTTITLGGNVTATGGAPLLERGVVYSLTTANASPQIGGSGVTKVAEGATITGAFTVYVSGLTASSGYSYAAYATNSAGTSYTSPASTFTTAATPPAGPPTLAFSAPSNIIYTRPGGSSFTWTYTTGTTPATGFPGTYPVTQIGYYNVTAFNWILTRGKFQYAATAAGPWTDMAVNNDSPSYVTTAGRVFRFVDNKPADLTTQDAVGVSWALQGPPGTVQTGVAALSNGTYAVAWNDSTNSVTKVKIGAAGTPFSAGIASGSGSASPRLAPYSAGFVVVNDATVMVGSTTTYPNIKAALFTNTGTAQGSAFTVNTRTAGNRLAPTVATLSGGGFVIAWHSDADDGFYNGITGRRYDSTGVAVDSADFQINQYRTQDQEMPVVTGLASNLFATAWMVYPDFNYADAEVVTRVLASGPAPTITVPGGTITLPSVLVNSAATGATFNISAANLGPATGNLIVTAPSGVQVSPDGATWSGSYAQGYAGGTLSSTAVYVRLATAASPGTVTGNVQITGGAASAVNQAVSGSVTYVPVFGSATVATDHSSYTAGAPITVTINNIKDQFGNAYLPSAANVQLTDVATSTVEVNASLPSGQSSYSYGTSSAVAGSKTVQVLIDGALAFSGSITVVSAGPTPFTTASVDSPPGAPGTSYASIRSGMSIASSGALAFRGYLTMGGTVNADNFMGMWKTPDGIPASVALVARSGSVAPDTGSGLYDVLPVNAVINNAAQTSFVGFVRVNTGSPNTTSSNDSGVWSELGGGGLHLMLREGTAITGGTVTAVAPSSWVATGNTKAAFTVQFASGSALVRGGISGGVGSVTTLATEGGAAPGGGTFDTFVGNSADPRMDASDDVAFLGYLQGSAGASGIYYQSASGSLVAVASSGQTSFGIADTFTAFERPSLGSSTEIAFRAFLATNGQAVFKGNPATQSSILPVAVTGDTSAQIATSRPVANFGASGARSATQTAR